MKRIVAATDGSAGAERAVAFAARLSKATGAELVLVTAAEEGGDDDLRRFIEAEHVTIGDALEARCDSNLGSARKIAEQAGAKVITSQRTIGDPTEFILHVAKDRKADLVVVGRRGRGRLEGLLLGSVSQKLVSLASCAIAVVP